MANGAALIRETIWRDKEFRALHRTAQCAYIQLLSQKDLDGTGVLILNIEMLVKGCDEMTAANLWQDLKDLERARFIVVDAEADEVLVRSYVRLVSVRSPNMWKSVKRRAKYVESAKIRCALAGELRRLGRADADDLANEITADQIPSETLLEPIGNPSGWGNPSERVPKPPVSVSVSVSDSPTVGGHLGEAPPKKTCDEHPDGTYERCGPCGTARQRYEAWEADQAAADAEERRKRRAAIDGCPYCDESGIREMSDDTVTRCTHEPEDW